MTIAMLVKGFQFIVGKSKNQEINQQVFGEEIGVAVKIFGCWHEKISRPFFEGRTAYRTCLKCGARKPFNPKTLQSYGKFYYPPIIKKVTD